MKSNDIKATIVGLSLAFLSPISTQAWAKSPKMCVFDIVGENGPAFEYAKDYALEARKWGVTLELEAYSDERIATENFKTGACDAMAVTTLRAREFNQFVGSLDAVGAVPSYQHLKVVINLLADPKYAKLNVAGPYEVAGILPLGAAYVHVNDKKLDSIEKAAGKRIAVLSYDKSQAKMVQQLGAQPVASEVIDFGTKFNNGQVDIVVAPAVAYQPLELYKGVGKNGGIYRFPLLQLTGNIMIRRDKFPEGFAQKSRQYVAGQFETAIGQINQAEKSIPATTWLSIPPKDEAKYFQMMLEARLQLTADKVYDKKMMALLKKVRCKLDRKLGECSTDQEKG